ncbi:hypothetical protein B0J14DRAFT_477280, partial [Halenospora varia]
LLQPEHLSTHRPIILDESYASPESAALHEEGYEGALVARADSPRERLSMSAYGKPAGPQLHGYEAGRTYPENQYPYTSSSYGSQPVSSASTPSFPNANQITPMAYPSNQPRPAYDEQGPYLNVGSTPIPEVTTYSPQRGSADSKVYVSITSLYELMTSNTPSFFLMFGHRKCTAVLSKASQSGSVCQYTVTADVPQLSTTSWSSSQVPIDMFMESGDGELIAKVNVGHFTYVSEETQNGGDSDLSRKRKISTDLTDHMRSPAKRPSTQVLRPKEEYGSSYGYSAADAAPQYSPYLQHSHSYGNIAPQYNRSLSSYPAQNASRHLGYTYTNSNAASPPTIKAQSPQVGSWSNGYVGGMVRSPGLPSNGGVGRLPSLPSPASAANPPLIRTSTLPQTPSPASTPHGGHHPGQHFNAYALYPHKAKLEIQGDLEAMAQTWSEEEWDAKRRLVHFRRSQSGSTITTTFQPVSVDERPPNSVCISCIYWEEKQECFVTSVDTIYLLEQLVAARFTVEEKNRIRRNLEGFRPLTVSKGKSDSEEFFKVIMAFPTPKPRNIEKDVKVFRWKDLSSALKKIIGKYSASPSSTLPPAPTLLTPVSATGYATDGSSTGLYANDHHGALSPRSISGSTASTYANSMPARVLSPHTQKPMALTGGPPDLRVALPQHPHDASHWQGQHHMQAGQQYQQLGTQSSRGSWDMSTYMENGPAASGSASAPSQSVNYPRNVADPAVAGGDNRITRIVSTQQPSHQMSRT